MDTEAEVLIKLLKDGAATKEEKKFLHGEARFGYDPFTTSSGTTQLGETLFKQGNKVVLGGIITILKKLFNVDSPLTIPTVNESLGIATTNIKPNGNNRLVFGFNVGIDGCGRAYDDVKVPLDQEAIVPGIIPFRIVDTIDDMGSVKNQYWLHKTLDNGKVAFFLKTFEGKISIHSLWKDSGDPDVDGSVVTGNPSESDRTEGIETFAEIVMRITAADLREYFELYDDPKYPRFSTMGLVVGELGTYVTGDLAGEEEMMDVIQFSILNFSNEMLHFDKDLTIIYRVYIS